MMSHAYDKYLEELIDEGKVDSVLLDESVRRVLRVKMLPRFIEKPYTGNHPDRFMRPDALSAARQLAAESMILLKTTLSGIPPLNGVGRA